MRAHVEHLHGGLHAGAAPHDISASRPAAGVDGRFAPACCHAAAEPPAAEHTMPGTPGTPGRAAPHCTWHTVTSTRWNTFTKAGPVLGTVMMSFRPSPGDVTDAPGRRPRSSDRTGRTTSAAAPASVYTRTCPTVSHPGAVTMSSTPSPVRSPVATRTPPGRCSHTCELRQHGGPSRCGLRHGSPAGTGARTASTRRLSGTSQLLPGRTITVSRHVPARCPHRMPVRGWPPRSDRASNNVPAHGISPPPLHHW